jgi:hypothetical protein
MQHQALHSYAMVLKVDVQRNANELNSLAQALSELVHIPNYYLLHILQNVEMFQGAPSLLFSSYRGLWTRKKRVCSVRQTTHPHLVARLRMNGTSPPPPYVPSWNM